MSELTRCNYCSLKELRRNKPKGSRIHLRVSSFMGGVDVFVVPQGEKLDKRSPDDGGGHWRRWFMELGDRCGC